MKKQNQPIHPQMKQPPVWRKATASVLTWVIPMQLAFPAYANIQLTRDVTKLQSALDSSARYQLASRVSEHLYEEVFMSPLADIFDGFGYFYQLAASRHPKQFDDLKWVPIGVGDITTMIPVAPQKPLFIGSPYVERDIVRLQLNQLLNRSYIVGEGEYENYNDMIKSLYDNALTLMQEKGYKFGQNLTSAQIDSISSDVIWPELRTLPTGKKVVIPFVYLSKTTIATNKIDKTTFSVGNGVINAGSFTVNGGEVLARRNLFIQTKQDFINYQGNIKAQENLKIQAGNNIENYSGTIQGRDTKLIANAIKNETLVFRHDYEYGFSELAGNLAKITGLNSLNLSTAGDVISKGGQFDSQGTLQINAGGSVQLLTQQVRQQHAQSGKKWTDSSQSLVNLQTKLSAVDILSIVAKNEIISQGAIVESEGILELLAGMGIQIIPAENLQAGEKSFKSSTGGIFGSDESYSESYQKTEILRSVLKGGNSVVLNTLMGDITLRAVSVSSLGVTKLVAPNGQINLELAKQLDQYSLEESYEGALSFRFKGHGHYRETAYYNEFIAKGGLMLDAANGINIQYAGNPDNIDETIANMAKSPEYRWLQDLRNDPNLATQWQEIELAIEEWNYDQSGLTPAAMAILAVAIAAATGGAGLTVMGGTGFMASAVNAAATTLLNQVTASMLANGGDLSATFKDVTSSDSLKNLATSMVTAGVLSEIDSLGWLAQGEDIGLLDQAKNTLIQSTVNAAVPSLIQGHSFSEFGDAFLQNVATSSVQQIGQSLAKQIGIAAGERGKDGLPKNPDIGAATQYITHAALGCALAGANSAISGGNSDTAKTSCFSGAGGAVIGEFIAKHKRAELEAIEKETENYIKEQLALIKTGQNVSPETLEAYKNSQYQKLLQLKASGVDIAKLAAGITVFAFGGDVDQAIYTSGNAAQNNAFFIPALFWAVNAALLAYSVYEFTEDVEAFVDLIRQGDTDKAKEVLIAALIDAGIDMTVGKGLKLVKAGETISDALQKLKIEELLEIASESLSKHGNHMLASEIDYLKKVMAGDLSAKEQRRLKGFDANNANHADKLPEFDNYQKAYPHGSLTFDRWLEMREVGEIGADGRWVRPATSKSVDIKAKSIGKQDDVSVDYNGLTKPTRGLDGQSIDNCNFDCFSELRQKAKQESETWLDTDKVNYYRAKQRIYSEAMGEMAGEATQAQNGAKRLMSHYPGSNDKRGQFDQIWHQPDGKIVIIEAKGGDSQLGSRIGLNGQRVQQGTKEYFESVVASMEKWYDINGSTLDATTKHEYRKTMNLLNDKNAIIEYKVVRQHIDTQTGKPTKVSVTDYNVI
ncbi:DUF637 domain-containing protein (plasmid) [Photobacterium sp. GJ3]|uniref:DUF637 domain-containing protein n=1 Tax=Photobacterium sp. GJ3 TaxID=2829502 RepID=UPI001B8B8CFF|nr:DUF637 domain-containing protein [Photobacterium sp. GJ3]QUJ70260.1 DUF637 domain-containing protein [Photobacterium sp. GJ3]